MSAQLHAGVPLADGSPARKLLEELSRSYRMVLVTDPKGRVHWLSESWLDPCGRRPDFTGRDIREAIPKTPRPEQSFEILTRLREQGFLLHSRVDRADANGETSALDVSIFPLQCSTGEGVQIVLARPADERANHPDAELIDFLPDAVLAADSDGFVDYANPACEALLGLAPEELRSCALAALPADGAGLGQLLRALEAGKPAEFEIDLRTNQSEPRTVAISLAPRANRGGCVLTLRAAAEANAALIRRNDELEHCVNALAHDLRSPLVALLGFSRLLRQDYGDRLDDTGAHFVDRIEQAGRTMEALIHDLLELSRIGQPGEHPAMIDPRSVLLQLAAELKQRLDTEAITLVLPEDPPPVYCDRTRLYQIFSNLLGNASSRPSRAWERERAVTGARAWGSRSCARSRTRGADARGSRAAAAPAPPFISRSRYTDPPRRRSDTTRAGSRRSQARPHRSASLRR
jgi:signal transduction histidine kinase